MRTGRPPFDPDVAEENSQAKAAPIAAYLYDAGLTRADAEALPWTVKGDRNAPSLRRLAVAALRASPEVADRQRNPPHGPTSDTWEWVWTALGDLEDKERYGHPDTRARARLAERDQWASPAGPVLEPTPPPRAPRPVDLIPWDVAPALVTSGARPLLPGDAVRERPRGWDQVAALPALDPPRPCRWCGSPAVVGTLNGWRCGAHPPVKGDPRGDWGWALNWEAAPARYCPPGACWCGRCGSYDTHGDPSGVTIREEIAARVDGPAPTR